jgi:hypothetical protein
MYIIQIQTRSLQVVNCLAWGALVLLPCLLGIPYDKESVGVGRVEPSQFGSSFLHRGIELILLVQKM